MKRSTNAAITHDSPMGRTLLALRAGPMTSGELNERFQGGFASTQLNRLGLVTRTEDLWVITDAGRAACPLRNPLAASVQTMPPEATRARQPAYGHSTKENTMTTKTTIELARDAITKSIAGITKESALKREELFARAETDIDHLTLRNVLRKMVLDQKRVGACGHTASRRYYDLATLVSEQSQIPGWTPVMDAKTRADKQKPETSVAEIEFSIYDDGRLAIMDEDEVLVLPPEATRRLGRFLGCFESVLSAAS